MNKPAPKSILKKIAKLNERLMAGTISAEEYQEKFLKLTLWRNRDK